MGKASAEWHDKAVEVYEQTKDLDAVVKVVNRDRSWVRKALVDRGVYEYQANGAYANGAAKGRARTFKHTWEITEDVPERACSRCKGKFKPRSRYIFRCNSCKKAQAYEYFA